MSKNIPVRFLKAWRTYFTGDVAGFSKELADDLVDGGVAEHASDSVASEAPGGRKGGRSNKSSKTAPTPSADPQDPPPPPGGAGEGGNGADDEEKP